MIACHGLGFLEQEALEYIEATYFYLIRKHCSLYASVLVQRLIDDDDDWDINPNIIEAMLEHIIKLPAAARRWHGFDTAFDWQRYIEGVVMPLVAYTRVACDGWPCQESDGSIMNDAGIRFASLTDLVDFASVPGALATKFRFRCALRCVPPALLLYMHFNEFFVRDGVVSQAEFIARRARHLLRSIMHLQRQERDDTVTRFIMHESVSYVRAMPFPPF